jgi:hypothetical protein
MVNSTHIILIHVEFDFNEIIFYSPIIDLYLNGISSYKLVTSVGIIVSIYILRCQELEFIYLKYLNTLPLNQLTINQLEDLILGYVSICP